MKIIHKTLIVLTTTITIVCSNKSNSQSLTGEFEFNTLHYLRMTIKKEDFFMLGKGKLNIFKDNNSNNYVVSLKYSKPRNDAFSNRPGVEYTKYNFEIKNVVKTDDVLRFTASADLGTVMVNCKVFIENGKRILAIEKDIAKYGHVNSELNPWFFKIDDEYVYYYLDTHESAKKEFYEKQIGWIKDSLYIQTLKPRKKKRLKNGVKHIEEKLLK